ncbi:MAG: glycosyltransferase family 2 protein [Sphingomicrobium sp.]
MTFQPSKILRSRPEALQPLISIVVPVKNEEEAVAPFVKRVAPILDKVADDGAWEILFVDDGSTDQTLCAIAGAHLSEPRVRCISLSRNFGKEAAISAGLDEARGKAVVPLDVDMQDPPEVIPEMVEQWRAGFEMVFGVRTCRATDSLPKRWTASLFYRAHNWLSAEKIPENAGDFRLLDEKVVKALRALPERNRFMKGLYAWCGFQQTSVEYHRDERKVGTTKFSYWKLWTLAVDGITSASSVPLRMWSYIGAAVAVVSLAFAITITCRILVFGVEVPGYASLMVAVLFFGGIQLISLGILGEYVGRILLETKQRPLYVVRDRIGLDGHASDGSASLGCSVPAAGHPALLGAL